MFSTRLGIYACFGLIDLSLVPLVRVNGICLAAPALAADAVG